MSGWINNATNKPRHSGQFWVCNIYRGEQCIFPAYWNGLQWENPDYRYQDGIYGDEPEHLDDVSHWMHYSPPGPPN